MRTGPLPLIMALVLWVKEQLIPKENMLPHVIMDKSIKLKPQVQDVHVQKKIMNGKDSFPPSPPSPCF